MPSNETHGQFLGHFEGSKGFRAQSASAFMNPEEGSKRGSSHLIIFGSIILPMFHQEGMEKTFTSYMIYMTYQEVQDSYQLPCNVKEHILEKPEKSDRM